MIKDIKIDEILEGLPHFAESANEEVRNILKASIGKLIQDMDLVYQEEVDILREMLSRTESRVTQLEHALSALESQK